MPVAELFLDVIAGTTIVAIVLGLPTILALVIVHLSRRRPPDE